MYKSVFIIFYYHRICESKKNPNEVLQNQINKYREVFQVAIERANLIDDSLAHYLDERPLQTEQIQLNTPVISTIFKCPKCGSDMVLKQRRQGRGKYITCTGYPECTNVIWFPETVEDVEVLNETCNRVNIFARCILCVSHKYICFRKLLNLCTINIFSVQKIYTN